MPSRPVKHGLPTGLLPVLLFSFVAWSDPGRPRLLFTAGELATRAAAWEGCWLREPRALLLRNAAKLAATPAVPYRMHGAVTGRAAQYQILTLGFAAHLEPESAYARAAREYLLAFCRALSPEQLGKLHAGLGVGDGAHALAVGRDWIAPWLSEEEGKEVDRRLVEYGEWLFRESQTAFWGRDERRRQAHNWAAVTHGGLGLVALVLGDRPEWVARASHQLSCYFAYSRDRDGAPYEGVSYGAYGLQNSIPFAVALKRAGGVDLLAGQEGMLHAPDHVLWHVMPGGGSVVPHNQSSGTLKPAGGMMHLIARSRSRTGLWGWLRLLGPEGDGSYGWSSWLGDNVSLPYVLLFADPALEPQNPVVAGLPLSHRFARGQVSMRDGWEADSSLVTITCGEGIPGIWNQGDEGSFTFAARGEDFAVDPGPKLGSTADHNAILIDGKGQASDGGPAAVQGEICRYEDFDDWCVVEADSTRAYAKRAPVESVRRRLVFVRRGGPLLVLVDDVVGTAGKHQFEWLLHTDPNNRIELGEGAAVIQGSRKGACCDVLALGSDGVVQEAATGRHGPLLRFRAEGEKVRFVVVLSARNKGMPARRAEWQGEQIRLSSPSPDVPPVTLDPETGRVVFGER